MKDKITLEDIEKWTKKLEPLVDNIIVTDQKGEDMLTNMKAYIADSKHFVENKDYVRGFEAMVWAWAIFELCRELDIFQVNR